MSILKAGGEATVLPSQLRWPQPGSASMYLFLIPVPPSSFILSSLLLILPLFLFPFLLLYPEFSLFGHQPQSHLNWWQLQWSLFKYIYNLSTENLEYTLSFRDIQLNPKAMPYIKTITVSENYIKRRKKNGNGNFSSLHVAPDVLKLTMEIVLTGDSQRFACLCAGMHYYIWKNFLLATFILKTFLLHIWFISAW